MLISFNEFLYSHIQNILENHYILMPVIFVLLQVMMAIFLLPCAPMTILAGILWGGLTGFLIAMIGSIASLSATFLLSRSIFKPKIIIFIDRRFPNIITKFPFVILDSWKTIALIQLNPTIPASAIGYVIGMGNLSIYNYILYSFIFMIPIQLLLFFTGLSIVELIFYNENIIILLSIILCFVLTTVFIKCRGSINEKI